MDLVICSAFGVDMFDCVYPTRTAVWLSVNHDCPRYTLCTMQRFGKALVRTGQLDLSAKKYANVCIL